MVTPSNGATPHSNGARAHAPPPANPTGRYAHIVGWGMAVPDKIMTNDDLAAFIETNDKWIQERTGIRERRIASERESAATLAYKAARKALDVANLLPSEIDLIIVATSTPEHIFPSTASLVQDWLGATRAGAFDLSAACSGFVYALDVAGRMIQAGGNQCALVIGSEAFSRVLNWQDRTTCILFGDGAGAVVLRASQEPGGLLSSVLRSDGSGCDLLAIPTVGSLDLTNRRHDEEERQGKMTMNGKEVFKFATRVVDESVRESVERAGLSMDDISLIIPHQANMRIIQAAARKLKIDESRFMVNVDRYGNTSAASIPIALVQAIEEGRIHENDHLVLVGFGGGLSWAAAVVQWGIPKPDEQHSSAVNRSLRQAAYTLSRWRNRFGRWRRQVNAVVVAFQRRRQKARRALPEASDQTQTSEQLPAGR